MKLKFHRIFYRVGFFFFHDLFFPARSVRQLRRGLQLGGRVFALGREPERRGVAGEGPEIRASHEKERFEFEALLYDGAGVETSKFKRSKMQSLF